MEALLLNYSILLDFSQKSENFATLSGRRRRRVRQGKAKSRPIVQLAIDFDRAAESIQQMLDDGQAEAGAADGPVPGFVGAIETVEDTGQVFGGDADAGILDGEVDPLAGRIGGDPDKAAVRRIFDGIVD